MTRDYRRRHMLVTVGALILLHFELLSVVGYPITVGLLLLPAFLALRAKLEMPTWGIAVFFGIASFCTLQTLVEPAADRIQFLRGLVLLLVACAAVGCAALSPAASLVSVGPRPYIVVLMLVDAMAWLQSLSGRHGSLRFFNPWGAHQYLYAYNPHIGLVDVRAEAFYLEPSFAALVLMAAGTAAILAGCRPVVALLLVAFGLAAVRSASGLISLSVMGLLAVLLPLSEQTTRRRRTDRLLLVMASLGFGMYFAPYILARLSTIHQVGSSSNYRIAAPFALVRSVLGSSLIGRPLGSVNATIGSLDLLNGVQSGTTLDNGAYVFVYYFGWVGIIGTVAGLIVAVQRARQSERVPARFILLTVTIGLSTLFTGAIFTPEYALVVAVVIIEYRVDPAQVLPPLRLALERAAPHDSRTLIRNSHAQ